MAAWADWLAATPGIVRLAIDGPPCAEPDRWADALGIALVPHARPFVHVRTRDFWRDASLRLEYGHEDVDAYADWVDVSTLRREVLDADGWYLPSLRDPETNRATRAERRPVPPGAIVCVSGGLLLGRGLPFDRAIHLAVSPAARARRTAESERWTLGAFDRYDAEVHPVEAADVVVRLDDPRHPAVRGPADRRDSLPGGK